MCSVHYGKVFCKKMTRTVLISWCVIFLVTIHATFQLECGYNEIETECLANCPSDYCPTSDEPVRPCPRPQECGQPQCKCQFNTRRATNGTCINTRDCPPFECTRPNEKYDPCPPLCPAEDCSQASPDGGCQIFGYIGIVIPCNPQCRCIKGYWKKAGVCVPYNQCAQD